jgi:hypothetical protein
MSLTTKITTTKSKQNLILITQQYEVGTYICIYNADENWNTVDSPLQQGGSILKERIIHEQWKKDCIKNNDTLIESPIK